MKSEIVGRERLDFKGNPERLSPPIVVEPLYQCAISVTVIAYVPEADIEVQVNGVTEAVMPGGFPFPHGVTISLNNELIAGDIVRARQITAIAGSDWSPEVVVRPHTDDYPAGPPRPVVNPAPVYECGIRTGVSNLLTGGHVWITADGATVGTVKGCSEHQGVNIAPAYGVGQRVRAWFKICNDLSPPSEEHIAQPPPSPLPQLTVEASYEGGESIRIGNVTNGARVTLYRNGVTVGNWGCWGFALIINGIGPLITGDVYSATQSLCIGDPSSDPGDDVVKPCSMLPAPQIGPVQAGDDRIILTSFVSDALITVYRNGAQVGASGGPIILLSEMLAAGDVIHIVQDLQGCMSQYALEVTVGCIAPPISDNPSGLNLFPVGFIEYNQGDERGIIYYPAEDDGKGQSFHGRLAELGRVPIVFLAHGNHSPADPSYLGYRYFQKELARMGIVAVSIDCNDLNGSGGGVGNIEDRADLIIANIAHFQILDATPSSLFFERIDFDRVGLMGHSRGGDAVVMVPAVMSLGGVTIRSALSLAPTNFRYWFGLPTIKPQRYAFMTVLPAGDGDVVDNNGAQFYDLAEPEPYKSQVYAHHTNHNFFNREWLYDDSTSYVQPPVMARGDHERILSAYGCSLFRASLLGHNVVGYMANYIRPSGVLNQHIYLSFQQQEALTVDNHEDGNGIGQNSLSQQTTQLAGMGADEFEFEQSGGAFNATFYGESIGMVAKPGRSGRIFRSELVGVEDLSELEVWICAAEVSDNLPVPSGSTGFELGLEDVNGLRAWVDSDEVGSLPRPYNRNPGMIKTMLNTLRFRGGCFVGDKEFDQQAIRAILLRCNRADERTFAFDDLQVIKRIF